jgi:hypothetical protein
MDHKAKNDALKRGMWWWGIIACSLAVPSLVLILASSAFLNIEGHFRSGVPPLLAGLDFALKDHGSLAAGMLGFSGLAWAYFFTAAVAQDGAERHNG